MLKTRVITALVLVPVTLCGNVRTAAECVGSSDVGRVAIAADEWARLAGLNRLWTTLFAVAVVAGGCCLLLTPYPGLLSVTGQRLSGYPSCVAWRPLFWFVVAPLWLGLAGASSRS